MAFTLPERERAAVRKQRYDACFILPVAEVDKGTSYPCTKRALALLTDENLPVLSPPDIVPASTATSTLEEALGPVFSSCPEAVAALQRFRVNGLNPQEWGPDLMFKVFGDLDRAFFMGKLKNRVILKWNNDRRFRHQGLVGVFDTRWGLAVCTDMRGISKKAWIYLNANKLLLPHYIQLGHIWSVLLHEMLVSHGHQVLVLVIYSLVVADTAL